jgi:hypothetical protein
MADVPEHMRVELDLEVGSDPIRGRLGQDPDTPHEFYGWIELAAALESLIAEHAAERTAP